MADYPQSRSSPPWSRLSCDDVLGIIDRAWERRCDSYDPWPDDPDVAAQHLFDVLRTALVDGYFDADHDEEVARG